MAIDHQGMSRWSFGTRLASLATATTLGAATMHEFSAVTIKVPVASGRFSTASGGRVLARVTGHLSGATAVDLDGYRVGIKINAVAYDDADVTVAIANSGNSWNFEVVRDVTSYFVTNDPGTSTFTSQVRVAFATGSASTVINVTAELSVTYGGDSSVTGRVASAVFPVQSHHLTPVGDGTTFTEIGTTGGVANAPVNQIRKLTGSGGAFDGVSGFAVLNRYLIVTAMTNKGTTGPVNMRIRHDGGGGVTTVTVPTQPLATNHKLTVLLDISGLSTSAAHSLEIGTDVAGTMEHVGALDVVTYDYDATSAVQFVSVILPLTNKNSDHASMLPRASVTADADKLVGVLNIAEPTPVADQCGVILSDGIFSSGVDTIMFGDGQTARTYDRSTTAGRTSHGIIVHRIDHSGASLSLSRGLMEIPINVSVSQVLATTGPAHGAMIVNYRCGLHPAGAHTHNRTVTAAQVVSYAEGIQTNQTPTAPVVIPADYLISGVLAECVDFCVVGGQDSSLSAQRNSGEDSGAGWCRDLQRGGNNLAELGATTFYRNCTSWFRRRPSSAQGLDVESTRKWNASSNSSSVGRQACLSITSHSAFLAVAGDVTIDGDPAPDGADVTVFALKENGEAELIGSAVIASGSFSVSSPYPTLDHVAVYDHLGRRGSSAFVTPGLDADIEIGAAGGGGGQLLSHTGTTDRWTPVRTTIALDPGEELFVILTVGQNRFCVYDAADVTDGDPQTGFSGFFRERSAYEIVGDNVVLTLLPSGGWWTREFKIKIIAGQEIT